MFATLLGSLPRPPLSPGASDLEELLVEAAVRAQEDAGLEPRSRTVGWRTAARRSSGGLAMAGPRRAPRSSRTSSAR